MYYYVNSTSEDIIIIMYYYVNFTSENIIIIIIIRVILFIMIFYDFISFKPRLFCILPR